MKSKLKGAVREFKAGFKGIPLIAVIEAVVNSIQAAETPRDAIINVRVIYENVQKDLFTDKVTSAPKGNVKAFEITDNGHGFMENNLDAFDELYTECKKELGCKGIGRITWLAIFDHVEVESYCEYAGKRSKVTFRFDEDNEITDKKIEPSDVTENRTQVRLVGVHSDYTDKIRTNAEKLAGLILDHCLSYYISGNYPDIRVQDVDGTYSVSELFTDRHYEVTKDELKVMDTEYSISHLLSKSTKTKSGAYSYYCANGRVVTENTLLNGVKPADSEEQYYSYILYLSGHYLDDNVSTDRLAFSIPSRTQLHDEGVPTLEDLEEAVEEKARSFLAPIMQGYENKCKQRAASYIKDHPEFKYVLSNRPQIISEVTPNAKSDDLYRLFNKTYAELESEYIFDFEKAATGSFDWKSDDERILFLKKIDETQQAVLAKYMSHRKYIIDLFEKQLRIYQDADGKMKYAEEDKIHDILMPMKTVSDKMTFTNCNMWMIDERLNYFAYTAAAYSDKKFKSFLKVDDDRRPDICIFSDKRGDQIHAVTIIELKRPDRTDKDVLEQVKDYVKGIKNGELKDYHGRPAKVSDDVVFYCYVLCDIDEKRYGEYLEDEEFSRIYSGRSYYRWFPKISAHIEFIDFDHLLNDTKVRNAIFFNLLNGKNPLERGPGEY